MKEFDLSSRYGVETKSGKDSSTPIDKKPSKDTRRPRYISTDPEFMRGATNLFIQNRDDLSIVDKVRLKSLNRRERRRNRVRRIPLFRDPTHIL